MEIHELLRKMRIDRGITQKQLADKITTRESVVKYENGKNQVPLLVLLELLEKMNVNLDEFLFYLQVDNIRIKNKELNKLVRCIHEGKKPPQYILHNLKIIADKTGDIVDVRNFLVAKAFNWYNRSGNEREFTHSNQIYIKQIIEYLDRVNEFGRFEITSFTSLLFLFETSYINQRMNEIEKKIEKNRDYEIFHTSLYALYNNAFLLMLERKDYLHAVKYLKKYSNVRNNMVFSRETEIYVNFYSLLLDYLFDGTGKEKELIQFFKGLKMISAEGLIDEFRSDLRKYEKIYGLCRIDIDV
ncbi:helix-turn-helix domain-containing protein [Enterococcus thailandicus]|uniref:helix-turn-helix domain-containing protein n=1 Tax=Enterococcus thailandicus TaxID=417368 RepID=UPI0035D949C1